METKDTFFASKSSLNLNGELLDLSTPLVMGILNLSPDSFYTLDQLEAIKPGEYSAGAILQRAARMLEEGAAILDLGGMSSRPGAQPVTVEEELDRLIPAIKAVHKEFPSAVLSVDTYRSQVLKQAASEGVLMLNDISAGSMDAELLDTVADLGMPYVLMHMQGTPATMQKKPHYENVSRELMDFFVDKVNILQAKGIKDIIIDPGFGFGKTLAHNYELLRNLDFFKILDLPLLVGISRKSMITRVLNVEPKDALNGTIALNSIALAKGARILRVHDVKEAMELIALMKHYDGTATL